MNGTAATVLYALGNQINTVAPFGLDISNPAAIEVRSQNQLLGGIAVPAAVASPALFTQDGTGIGPGAILNQDYTLNSPLNPAPVGSIVMMYGTAFGPLNPPSVDGQPGVSSATTMPVSASIAGSPAEVTYAGAAPGLAAGLVQINVKVPNVAADQTAAVILSAGGLVTPPGVTIAIR